MNLAVPISLSARIRNTMLADRPDKLPNETGGCGRLSEEPMSGRIPKTLLIGENPQGSSYLARRLQGQGCECSFATSYPEACSSLRSQGFEVVLSPMRLRGVTVFPLMDLLAGSRVTLFFSHAVERGCWWLPALRHGEKCFGSSALRSRDFVSVLDEVIAEIRMDWRVTGNL